MRGPESQLSVPLLVTVLNLLARERGHYLPVKKVVSILKWDQSILLKHLHFLSENGYLRRAAKTAEGKECFALANGELQNALQRLVRQMASIQFEGFQLQVDAPPPRPAETRAQVPSLTPATV